MTDQISQFVEMGEPNAAKQPSLRVLGQYVKDLSFESPQIPNSLVSDGSNPEISVSVNVNTRNISKSDYEVELKLEARAQLKGKTVFVVELNYGAVFRLDNIPAELIQPMLLIECPRLIFPFARQILADTTRYGGFAPVMLDPLDFGSIYQGKLQSARSEK